jgi:hypothetical protein
MITLTIDKSVSTLVVSNPLIGLGLDAGGTFVCCAIFLSVSPLPWTLGPGQ